jgi:hypothetical protein
LENYFLIRFRETPDGFGVVGKFCNAVDMETICFTYELPWNDNKRSDSCIPAGTYKCIVKYSHSKGRVFEILGVKDRSGILIHVGNTHVDTDGCVLVGRDLYQNSIGRSRIAMGEILMKLPDEFELTVVDKYRKD